MSDDPVTRILHAAESGQASPSAAADLLLPLVYEQLRAIAAERMKNERRDHTLQATALVHEAFLKLVGGEGPVRAQQWSGRAAFYAAAAEAMRRILIDHARRRHREKHGGQSRRLSFDDLSAIGSVADLGRLDRSEEILAFDSAFRRLEEHDQRFAAVVRLRFFAGLDIAQTAQALGVSERTVNNDWNYARAWLARAIAVGK